MNRRRAIVWVLVAAAVAVCALLIGRNREPRYQGRTLSQWLSKYWKEDRSWGAAERAETEKAVHSIGTNALPWLLLWIQEEDSRPRQRLFRLLERAGISRIDLRRAGRFRSLAFFGFHILGPDARAAVPALTRLLDNDGPAVDFGSHWGTVAENAASALGDIGVPAVPALALALTNRDFRIRQYAAQRLGGIGPDAQASIPALVMALNDTNGSVRLLATRSLGLIHARPENLVGLTNLETLRLDGTKVSEKGVKALQHELPNCSIEWGPH